MEVNTTTVELDNNLHTRLKVYAAEKRITLKSLVAQALNEYLEKQNKVNNTSR